ncbi:MAG: amidohydrolase family protein [Chloroflexi bacterium]|nr:amidohydrolase family protein [Chloroflexota bacterium]
MLDLFINNGTLVTPQGLLRAGIGVQSGRIATISADNLPASRTVDAHGLYVLPGLIDPHVHMGLGAAHGQGEATYASDFESEAVSAAVGGVTTIITSATFGRSAESVLARMQRAKQLAAQRSVVDFKIFPFLVSKKHVEEIPELLNEGITNFKFPLAYVGQEHWRQPGMGVDWAFLYRGLELVARCGPAALAMIHAEEPTLGDFLEARYKAEGRDKLSAYSEARPSACETMHIFAAGLLAGELGAPLYVVHTSAKESVDAIQYLQARGARVYGETCPHYLVLTRDAEAGVLAKVNPPLRQEADSERLWQGIREGVITTIGTDHCPHKRTAKEGGIWEAIPGFGSIAATLPLLVSEGVNKGRISWELLAKITSENVARTFGIYPQKGVLSPGSDADIVLVDPSQEWTLTAGALHSACDFSIYEGMKVKGRGVKTYVRGRLVAENGQPVKSLPFAQYVY